MEFEYAESCRTSDVLGCVKSMADSKDTGPKRANPKATTTKPVQAEPRRDSGKPRCKWLSIESGGPKHMKDRIDDSNFEVVKSRIKGGMSSFVRLKVEKLEPN